MRTSPPAWCGGTLPPVPQAQGALLRRVLRADRLSPQSAEAGTGRGSPACSQPRICSQLPCSASGSRGTTRWRSSTTAPASSTSCSARSRLASPRKTPGAPPTSPGAGLLEAVGRDLRHRARPEGNRIGPAAAGKLLARKRPHLLPVYDSRIKKILSRPRTDNQWWHDLHDQLVNDPGLVQELESVLPGIDDAFA